MCLFSESTPTATAAEIAAALGTTINTAYRDLHTLRQHGFIEQAAGDRFTLGGQISVLDRTSRKTNPLLTAGFQEMERLAEATRLTVTLTRLFGNSVIGLGQADGDREISVGYERGQLVPLFRGCTGKVILAALPWRQLRRIFATGSNEIRLAGLGGTWGDFLANVRRFGGRSYLWTEGEINPENLAVATVLRGASGEPLGSLTIIIRRAMADTIHRPELEMELLQARQRIEEELGRVSLGR